MYLMDCVVETAARVKTLPRPLNRPFLDKNPSLLDIYPVMAERLVGTPRFLFDEDATQTAVELTLGRPKVFLEAMLNCRIPYPRMWVEWPEWGREKLRQKFAGDVSSSRPLPDRVGFYLESDTSGRRGRAVWFWSALKDTIPNVAPFAPFFDLDKDHGMPQERVTGLLKGNLGKEWAGNTTQTEALLGIWRTAAHAPHGRWAENYLRLLHQQQGQQAIDYAMADVYGEYIQLWSSILLLTSSRKIVDLKPVDLTRLNKARVKKREVAKLDHTLVTMHVDLSLRQTQIRDPLGYKRKSPRVHMVSSYLGRRGFKHWVVQPYTRGSGEIIHRRVQVRS